MPALRKAVPNLRNQGILGEGPRKRGLVGALFIKLSEPPPFLRAKAPAKFTAEPREPRDKVVASFLSVQEEFRQLLFEADGLDLWRAKVKFPPIPLVRLGLGVNFAIFLAHERRHIWQAEQVRADPRFSG